MRRDVGGMGQSVPEVALFSSFPISPEAVPARRQGIGFQQGVREGVRERLQCRLISDN